MYELLFTGPFGGTKKERLSELWTTIQATYDTLACPTRLTHIKEDMCCSQGDFAVLNVKAAEAQHLLPTMCEICRDLQDGSPRDAHRLLALESLAGVYKIFKDGDMCLSLPVAEHALQLLETHLLHYNWLLKNALANGYLCYPLKYKTHNIWHIVSMHAT